MSATVLKLPSVQQADAGPPGPAPDGERGLRSRIWIALGLVVLLIAVVGGWAANAGLAGAVIASGQLMVDSNTKKVQHPSGGVVGEILVKNGDFVKSGDIVMRLDDTQTRAQLGIVTSQIREMIARQARLRAERDGLDEVSFPAGYEKRGLAERRIADGERRYFNARRDTIASEAQQLRERIGQLAQEISGLTAQRDAKARELKLVRTELKRVEDLYARRLTPVTRVLSMQRDEARIDGELGALISRIARARGQISEIDIQILNLEKNQRSEAQRELRDIEARVAELRERQVAAEDMLSRVDIRAPITGVVHDLSVHTVGGVVNAAEPLMLIVPLDERLVIEARVRPADIDQVSVGQLAMLRFTAFNQRTTPQIEGRVALVGADVSADASANTTFYRVRIRAAEGELSKLADVRLVAGMPVEVFIQTDQRSALSYIMKPVTDQFKRAWRED